MTPLPTEATDVAIGIGMSDAGTRSSMPGTMVTGKYREPEKLMSELLPCLLTTVTLPSASAWAADKKIALIAGEPSHGPGICEQTSDGKRITREFYFD